MSCDNVNIENFPLAVSSGSLSPSYKEIYKFGNLFVNKIGEYQELGYKYIIDRLRNRGESYQMTKTGTKRNVAAFSTLKSFNFTDLSFEQLTI